MSFTPTIAAFWHDYLATRPDGSVPPFDGDPVWTFGSTPEDATSVGQLVRAGIKTATSGLLWEYEHDQQPVGAAGVFAIVVDGAGSPLCVIEITDVAVRPFHAIDAPFAYVYGEYGRTLDQWQTASWSYFSACCVEIGRVPSSTMPMVCTWFRVVYPASPALIDVDDD